MYMNNIFFFAGIVSVIFFIVKFAEMRVVDKESKPLKYLIRDSLLVYFSIIVGNFLVDQLQPILVDGEISLPKHPTVFTDNPEF